MVGAGLLQPLRSLASSSQKEEDKNDGSQLIQQDKGIPKQNTPYLLRSVKTVRRRLND